MLSIYLKPGGAKGKTEWHVGEEVPIDAGCVECVQADGDELHHILMEFKNLPRLVAHGKLVTWWGDHAKFIVANL